MTVPLLELRAVAKSFGSTRALSGVSFDLRPGEVHVLAGGNGAGKSTLIKILSGAITDFEGELRVSGEMVRFDEPHSAVRAGVATIHQELSLVPSLSVIDNLFLGERRSLAAPWLAARRLDEARQILEQVGVGVDPRERVECLGLAKRQLIEIARALHQAARVLILDEPTSALSEPEAKLLFERVAELREQGKGIVFISHRLEEIFRVADRVTVLRDGRGVFSGAASELDEGSLVEKMAGRSVERDSATAEGQPGPVTLAVSGLGVPGGPGGRPLLDRVSFEARAGEIVGVAGLSDSGASEVLLALFGAIAPRPVGKMTLSGDAYAPRSPVQAVSRGVTLLARDRSHSVFSARPVADNVTLTSLRRLFPHGLLSLTSERRLATAMTNRLALVAPSMAAPAGCLSGGNQQKVALARCLLSKPKLLLLDDPTRGIDVAAKADVHRLVREVAARGATVLVASSEFDELMTLCHRVLVLFRGKCRADLSRAEFDRERLLALAMGGEGAAA